MQQSELLASLSPCRALPQSGKGSQLLTVLISSQVTCLHKQQLCRAKSLGAILLGKLHTKASALKGRDHKPVTEGRVT